MNLKPRFLLLTAVLFVISAIPVWFAVRMLAEGITEQWAVLYAEKQALYDKHRTLQPILREVAISRQLASSPYIREWARNPGSSYHTRRAIAEMESYRENFTDHLYFVALLKNGHYYFNNAENEFKGKELRYILNPSAEKDSWFYDQIKQNRDMHLNVSFDQELGVAKLWVNVLIRDGNDIAGITGTGLNLSEVITNITTETPLGVSSLFIDQQGAIQLYRNPSLADSHTADGQATKYKTLEQLFPDESDRKNILAAMKELSTLYPRYG